MQLIFTGPQRDAVALHRILNADGIDAVCMTGTDHPTGAVFVPAEDAENLATIDRAIERMERERDDEGEGTANKDTHQRGLDELRRRAPELPGARGSLRSLPAGPQTRLGGADERRSGPCKIVSRTATSSSSPVRTKPGDHPRAQDPRRTSLARRTGSPSVRRFSPEHEKRGSL